MKKLKISVSLLSTYLYCSRKLFLSEVLLLKEPPRESLILGSLRHQVFDAINKKEESIVKSISKKMGIGEIRDAYWHAYLDSAKEIILRNKKRLESVNVGLLDAYKAVSPGIMEESSVRGENTFNFIEASGLLGDSLWESLTPKIVSELRVESDKMRLKGVIDQVYIYEDRCIPYELKTGSSPKDGVWPSHRIQVASYALLLQERFGKSVDEGMVVYLDAKDKRRIAMNPFMKEEVLNTVDEVIKLLESPELPDFCGNENKCRKCGLRETCYNENEVDKLLKIKLRNI